MGIRVIDAPVMLHFHIHTVEAPDATLTYALSIPSLAPNVVAAAFTELLYHLSAPEVIAGFAKAISAQAKPTAPEPGEN